MPIRYPDGKVKKVEPGKSIIDQIDGTGEYLCARVDGKLVDLSYVLKGNEDVQLLTFNDPEGRQTYWHTSSHILAQAVKELFPNAKLSIGPPIENGFYYDFYMGDYTFTPEDLKRIERKALSIIKKDLKILRKELPRSEAIELFMSKDEPFKVELLNEMDDVVSTYTQGEFEDLCRGPHLPSTGYVKAFKVLTSSSSYWKGNENGPVLQRIYGISFPTEDELNQFLRRVEEARRRDHRILGKQLDLFSFSREIGPGLVLWHPKGAVIRKEIEDYLYEIHLERGYQFVYTPHIGRSKLWEISGHLDFYREAMYSPMDIEGEEYYVKPMNCPFHIQIYQSKHRSYRDLPIRYAEFGTVYRYERSGVLHGLARVRGFTQDDAHIFATKEQVEDEIINVIDLALVVLRRFGFEEFEVYISTRPERYVGSDEMWELATTSLISAASKANLVYKIEEGEGAFYGPKIDIVIRDALDRPWQCTTIQFDFNLPEKFDLFYRDADGRDKKPIMIHRALLGSFERFFGVLIEHYGGNFPSWLAPIQVAILPISERFLEYGEEVEKTLKSKGYRAVLDRRSEKIGFKIREHETKKVPYMLILGEKEWKSNTVSVRKHGDGDIGKMGLAEFIAYLEKELKNP